MRFAFASRVNDVTERDLVSAYLDKVKKAAGVTSDADLADCLEVGKATVSAWRQRGNVPFKMQKDINNKYGIILEGNDAHIPQNNQYSPHIGALIFLTILVRGEKISFGEKVDTAYWWSRRLPQLTRLFGSEIVKRCEDRIVELRKLGIASYFDPHSPKEDDLRDAVNEIAFDIEKERFLSLSELESLPYVDR